MRLEPPRSARRELPLRAQQSDEQVVADHRATLRPAQIVEGKLMELLQGAMLHVSQVRTANLNGSRSHC
jgi:hypothetical protein